MTQPILPKPTPTPGDPAPAPGPANPPPTDPPKPGDEPLGAAGLKALQAERDRVKVLEQQLTELGPKLAGLAPLQQLAEALGAKADPKNGLSEVDALKQRFEDLNKTLESERSGRWRAEIAQQLGLAPELAARLQGATREELLADGQALAALIPKAADGPRTPAPDPSQGSRGGTNGDLESLIAAAQKAGDYRKVIALQQQKLINTQ